MPSDTCWACGATAAPDPEFRAHELLRCPACGLLFSPARAADELQDLYDESYFEEYGGEPYEDDEAQRRKEASIRVDLVRRFRDGGRLLEVGAASGYFLEAARDAGFEVMGVEPADNMAEAARRRFGLDVITGFVEHVELEAASFDVACGWHVLEHMAHPRPALERLRRALRPGGHLLLEVPNVGSLQARRRGSGWYHLDLEHHVAHYTADALRALLEGSGYELLGTESFPGLGYTRLGRAVRPLEAAMQVLEVAQARTVPRRPHPWKHELLRGFARVPGA